MARDLEEIPQEMDVESSETDAMLSGAPEQRRCSRSSVGMAFLGLAMLAMLLALALPKEHHLRKTHDKVIGLNDDSIWASVLSKDAMKQYQQQKEKSGEAVSNAKAQVEATAQKATNDLTDAWKKSSQQINNVVNSHKQEADKAVNDMKDGAQSLIDQLQAQVEDHSKKPMEAVQQAADQVKSVLNLGLPPKPAPATPAPKPAAPTPPVSPVSPVPPIAAPKVPKIQMPSMPKPVALTNAANDFAQSMGSMANDVKSQVMSKSDKLNQMAENFLTEASKPGNEAQKAQFESIAGMLKKDAAKASGEVSSAAGAAVAAVAPPVAAPAAETKTVTDNPAASPLAPKVTDKSGDPCVDDEEEFGGLCYKKCALLSGGSHPCRSSAWSCCAVAAGPNCQAKASFGNCWIHMGFCGGYSVAGDQEAAEGGSCPTGEGGCLTNEELVGDVCYKKCSLLSPQFPHRVGPSSCCSHTGIFDCFWPMNLHTSPSFNVGGGEGDGNSGTPNTAHSPMLQLSQ